MHKNLLKTETPNTTLHLYQLAATLSWRYLGLGIVGLLQYLFICAGIDGIAERQ